MMKKLTRKEAKKRFNNNLSRKKVNKNCQLQEVWVWPSVVDDKIKQLIHGYTLNCPAGLSEIGDVKGDLEPQAEGIKQMDMTKLPFKDNTFDTVISDPPWKINFFKRMKPFFETVRVCKVGGRIIYNCTWKPVSKYVKLEKTIIRTDTNWAMVSVIWIFKKIADVPKK